MPKLNNYYNHHLGILLDSEQQMIEGMKKINKWGPYPNTSHRFRSNEQVNAQWWNSTYPLHADFEYQHNEWGFRSGAIVRECAVAFYGCSQTDGTGVPESTRWCDLVASQHGLSFNNFGAGGAGTDKILDIFWATSQHVKMKTAVFMLNGMYRPHVVLGNGKDIEYHVLNAQTTRTNSNILIENIDYYRDQLFSLPDEYFDHVNAQALIKIHKLCKLMGIRAIFSTYLETGHDQLLAIQKQLPITVAPGPQTVLEDSVDHKLARDRNHLGMEANQKLSLLFKDLF